MNLRAIIAILLVASFVFTIFPHVSQTAPLAKEMACPMPSASVQLTSRSVGDEVFLQARISSVIPLSNVRAKLITELAVEDNVRVLNLAPLREAQISWRAHACENDSWRVSCELSTENGTRISSDTLYLARSGNSIVEREMPYVSPAHGPVIANARAFEYAPNDSRALINIAVTWVYNDYYQAEQVCKYAYCELWRQSGASYTVVRTGNTDASGLVTFSNVDSGSLAVVIWADDMISTVNKKSVKLTDGSNNPYYWWTGYMSLSDSYTATHVISVNNGTWCAYHAVRTEYDWMKAKTGYTRPQVVVRWPVEDWPHSHGDQIDIPNVSGWEDAIWDVSTIQHEYAHSIMYTAYGNTFPSGTGPDPHMPDSESSGGFALCEGFAEFMPCAVMNTPEMGGGWGSIESTVYADNPYGNGLPPEGDWDGNIVEGSVAAIMWDLLDGNSASDFPAWMACMYGDFVNDIYSDMWYVLRIYRPGDMNDFWTHCNASIVNAALWGDFYHQRMSMDASAPSNPTGVTSTPAPNVWTNDNTIDATLSGATDNLAGVWRYFYSFTSSPQDPGTSTYSLSAVLPSTAVSEGTWYLNSRACDRADNRPAGYFSSQPFKIDLTAPSNPNSYTSSHTINVWSSDTTIAVSWSGAYDAMSGVYGYSVAWDTSASSLPDITIDTTSASAVSPSLADGSWYVHIRTRDNAGNWATSAFHVGPFKIDSMPPSNPSSYTSSHVANGWSNDTTIDITWFGAYDGGYGVSGYSYSWTSTPGIPDPSSDTASNTATSNALSDGRYYFNVRACDGGGSWNASAYSCGPFGIDTLSPMNPTTYTSSHTANSWSNDTTIFISWSGAFDSLSGIAGYSILWDHYANSLPDMTIDTAGASMTSSALACGSWYAHVRTMDNASNWSPGALHAGPFMIDNICPSTTMSISGTLSSGWYSVAPMVTLAAMEAESGIQATEYRLDGGNWQTYSSPFAISAEGSHILEFRSIDLAGNVEGTKSANVRVDLGAPSTFANLSGSTGSGGWYSSSVTVRVNGTDTGSGIKRVMFRIDGGSWTQYSSQFVVSATGMHTIEHYAQDNANNTGAISTTTFSIDLVPPSSDSPSCAPSIIYDNENGSIRLSVQWRDAESGIDEVRFNFRLGNGALRSCISTGNSGDLYWYDIPKTDWVTGVGKMLSWNSTARDRANGTSSTAMLQGAQIIDDDASPPEVAEQGETQSYSFRVVAEDASGFELIVRYYFSSAPSEIFEDSAATSNSTQTTLSIAPSRGDIFSHLGEAIFWNFTVRDLDSDRDGDASSNAWSGWIEGRTITDSTPPVTAINVSGTLGKNGWYVSIVKVAFSAFDDLTGVARTMFRIDNGSWAQYSGLVDIVEGSHEISYYSIDNAGTRENARKALIRIDLTHPYVASSAPASGETGVPRDTGIVVVFSEKMNKSATEGGLEISGIDSSLLSLTWPDDLTLMITLPMLENSAEYAVLIYAEDLAGLGMNYSFAFSTAGEQSSSFGTLLPVMLVGVLVIIIILIFIILLWRKKARSRTHAEPQNHTSGMQNTVSQTSYSSSYETAHNVESTSYGQPEQYNPEFRPQTSYSPYSAVVQKFEPPSYSEQQYEQNAGMRYDRSSYSPYAPITNRYEPPSYAPHAGEEKNGDSKIRIIKE